MSACPCSKCHPSTLTGIDRNNLESLRERFAKLGADDQPMVDIEMADHTVVKVAVFPWEDVVEMVARDCIGEVE